MAPNNKKKKTLTNSSRGFATVSLPSKKAKSSEDASKSEDHNQTPAHPEAGNASLQVQPGEFVDPHTRVLEYSQDSVKTPNELAGEDIETSELRILWDKYASRCKDEVVRQVNRLRVESRTLKSKAVPIGLSKWMTNEIISSILARASANPRSTLSTSESTSSLTPDEILLKLWVLRQVLIQLEIPGVDGAIAYVATLSCKQQFVVSKEDLWGLSEALEWTIINSDPDKLSSVFGPSDAKLTDQLREVETAEGSRSPFSA